MAEGAFFGQAHPLLLQEEGAIVYARYLHASLHVRVVKLIDLYFEKTNKLMFIFDYW